MSYDSRKPSDHFKDIVARDYGTNVNYTGAERGQAADVLARMIQKDYPNMRWQDCQTMAGNAASYGTPRW